MGMIRFDPSARLVVVPAVVAGRKPVPPKGLRLVLDSGASRTMLPWGFLISLGYDPGASPERTRIVTGSSVEYAPLVTVNALSAVGETVQDCQVVCHDLPEEARVDGLLGMDFLRHFDVLLSFSRGVLELLPRS